MVLVALVTEPHQQPTKAVVVVAVVVQAAQVYMVSVTHIIKVAVVHTAAVQAEHM